MRRVTRGFALVLAGALAACSSATSSDQRRGNAHSVSIATGQGDPSSLNIHFDPSAVTGYVAELTAAYLARYDQHADPVPELATVIPTQANGGISRDGKSITWHLRKGVKWSDGAPFTADDVAFTVRAILNPKNNEEQGTAGWDLIEKMDEPDPYTIVFRLKQPYGSYLPLYFGSAANEPTILPKHLLGALPDINNAPFNAKPVGIGPFRVVRWKRGDAIEMEANPYYWRGKPGLQHVTFKLLASMETLAAQMQSGEVDIWPLMSPSSTARMMSLSNLNVIVKPNFRTTNLDFQMENRPLVSDRRVREAIRYAIDRKQMLATILHGYGFLHDGVVIPLGPLDENLSVIPFDPARARALLDAAGWRPGGDGIRARNGVRLSLALVFPVGTQELAQTVELIRFGLRAVGIDIQSKAYTPSLFRALQQNGGVLYGGKWDLALYPRTLEAVSDVYGLYSCQTRPPHGENATRYCNPRVDDLLRETDASYDTRLRIKRFDSVQQQIDADVPTVILYVWKGGYAWNKAVSGFDPPLLTPFDRMMDVDIKER